MISRSGFAATLVALCVLSGCGGAPGPSGATAAPTTTSGDGRFGAPRVQRPLALGPRASAPCDSLLGPADLSALGLDPASERQAAYAEAVACRWNADTEKSNPSLTLTTTPNRNKFVDAYRARVLPIFTPTTISGFPAVNETSVPADIMCLATVAVNDDEGVAATWYARGPVSPPNEACDDADRALAAVITRLEPR